MATKIERQGTKRVAKKELILSLGENLFLWRKRMGWNQSKAANKFKCSLFDYKMAEYDKSDGRFCYNPTAAIIPTDSERCVIYRRRAVRLQRDIAKVLGVSRYWINRQEAGVEDCKKLLAYWEGT